MLRMYYIDKLEDERIYFILTYSMFASLAVRVHLIDVLEDISSSVVFRKIRFRMGQSLVEQKKAVKDAMDTYEKNKSTWEKYSIDLKSFNPNLVDFFDYYGYKIIEETGQITK